MHACDNVFGNGGSTLQRRLRSHSPLEKITINMPHDVITVPVDADAVVVVDVRVHRAGSRCARATIERLNEKGPFSFVATTFVAATLWGTRMKIRALG